MLQVQSTHEIQVPNRRSSPFPGGRPRFHSLRGNWSVVMQGKFLAMGSLKNKANRRTRQRTRQTRIRRIRRIRIIGTHVVHFCQMYDILWPFINGHLRQTRMSMFSTTPPGRTERHSRHSLHHSVPDAAPPTSAGSASVSMSVFATTSSKETMANSQKIKKPEWKARAFGNSWVADCF